MNIYIYIYALLRASCLVARTSSSRRCPVADEEHVRNSAGSTSMASENFWMDGIA
jgi:hypothetical protein